MKGNLKKFVCLLLCVGSAFTAACTGSAESSSSSPTPVQPVTQQTDSYLVKEGVSDYVIVLPTTPTQSEEFAAKELNEIFYASTGVELPVVFESATLPEKFISIGETNAFDGLNVTLSSLDLGMGGFVLKTVGDDVYINSDTESGKIYGVYELCERNLGYRYFAADEIQYTQTKTTFLKDFDLTVAPSFDGRHTDSYYNQFDDLNAVRLRTNEHKSSWGEKFGEASNWATLHDMSNNFQLLYVKDYYPEHSDWFYVNEEWRNKKDQFATMSDSEFYVCAQKYAQLCFTHGYYDDTEGGMFDTYVNNLIEYIVNEPDKTLFMLGMGDNNLVCDCETCQRDIEKYQVSGVTLRFVNKVARAVDEWLKTESGTPDREVYLVMFAYLTAMDAPVKYVDKVASPVDESVVAEDNVCIRIAPLTNAGYYWPLDDEEKNTFMAKTVREWQLCAKHFAIWDYRVYYSGLFAPYPWWNTVKSNLEIYKDMDVISVMHQGYSLVKTPFNKLDDYVRARLLYDLTLDVGVLVDEFVNAYYKETAPYIKEYMTLLQLHYENHITKQTNYSGSVYSDIYSKKFWPLETLLQMENIFLRAYDFIETLPEERRTLLKNRLDYESRFYRYVLIDTYHDSFTKQELKVRIDEFVAANTVDGLTEYEVRKYMDDKMENWLTYLN